MATKHLDYAGLAHVIAKLMAREFQGKGLSTEDFTSALKNKLAALPATAVDTATFTALQTKVTALEKLIEADSDGAINKFNEIVAFLKGVSDTKTLQGLLADISTQIGSKVSTEEFEGWKSSWNDDMQSVQTDVAVIQDSLSAVDKKASDNATKIATLETTVGGITSITNAEIDALIAAGGVIS